MRNGSPPALMHNAHDCEYGSQSSARQRKGLPVRTALQQQLFMENSENALMQSRLCITPIRK